MKYTNSTFSVSSPGTTTYRDNWDRTFAKRGFTILDGDLACKSCSNEQDGAQFFHWHTGTCTCSCHSLL